MTDQNKNIWQGRNDEEEGEGALRWHHRVVFQDDVSSSDTTNDFALIGFCCDEGVERNQGRVGAQEGPDAFRQQLKNIAWHNNDAKLVDHGNIRCDDGDLDKAQSDLATAVASALPAHKQVMVIGGGHETAVGSFKGLFDHLGPEHRIGIINLDAHLDLRMPPKVGPSSGTPFYQIRELTGADKFKYICLGASRESNTKSLFERADEWGVQYIYDTDLRNFDPAWLSLELEKFASNVDAIYLTIDLDVLPHYQAPGVSAPAVRGVAFQDIEKIIHIVNTVSKKCRFGLPLADIVELSPQFDTQGVTAKSAAVLATLILNETEETGK